jgi:TolB protein
MIAGEFLMTAKNVGLAWALLLAMSLLALEFQAPHPPELFLKDVVSTAASEIKITFSPDGSRMLWGSTNRTGGPGGWDIWESLRGDEGWSEPRPAAFNSAQNDFDPSFDPGGAGVYFFSNRPGGLGKDDIWFAPFDPAAGTYGAARNLGPAVNSSGDEWAPVVSPDGRRLLFASDGRGGRGLHDLFYCERQGQYWAVARLLPGAANSADDDFDAAWLHDGKTLVFTRRSQDQDGADLYICTEKDGRYGEPRRLPAGVNSAGGWNLGPSIHPQEPGWLYFTSHRPDDAAGRLDIYRVTYVLAD